MNLKMLIEESNFWPYRRSSRGLEDRETQKKSRRD